MDSRLRNRNLSPAEAARVQRQLGQVPPGKFLPGEHVRVLSNYESRVFEKEINLIRGRIGIIDYVHGVAEVKSMYRLRLVEPVHTTSTDVYAIHVFGDEIELV